MARPVIALLTDFGTRDHYAGTMKGVALGDLSRRHARRHLARHRRARRPRRRARARRRVPLFPAGTIFLVVVDPGVGSARRGIAADTGDYRFVAPDNGVLTAVLDEHPPKRVVELTERKYARPTVSRTFEGRDRFAPAAAWLAKGIDLAALGRSAGAIHRLDIPRPALDDGRDRRAGAARRSLRQSDHEHRSPDVREAGGRAARHPRRRRTRCRGSCRRTPTRRRAKSARCSAAPTIWRSRPTARSAADALDLRPRRGRARRPPRVIGFRAYHD